MRADTLRVISPIKSFLLCIAHTPEACGAADMRNRQEIDDKKGKTDRRFHDLHNQPPKLRAMITPGKYFVAVMLSVFDSFYMMRYYPDRPAYCINGRFFRANRGNSFNPSCSWRSEL
jgi:hypothetical protein